MTYVIYINGKGIERINKMAIKDIELKFDATLEREGTEAFTFSDYEKGIFLRK